jgi:dolichyl-phosphate beta-glucosyltransferase
VTGAPQLSVVIPAFNEEARLGPTLERLEGWLSRWGGSFEVLVVDNRKAHRTENDAQE